MATREGFSKARRAARARERPQRLLDQPPVQPAGRCIACGSFVLADDAQMRLRDDVVHEACGLLGPEVLSDERGVADDGH